MRKLNFMTTCLTSKNTSEWEDTELANKPFKPLENNFTVR